MPNNNAYTMLLHSFAMLKHFGYNLKFYWKMFYVHSIPFKLIQILDWCIRNGVSQYNTLFQQ
jgi:hypothetical protein